MRVLSTKLPMVGSFTEKEMFSIIIEWLKKEGCCATIGEKFEQSEKKNDVCLQDGYYTLNTLVTEKESARFYLFKLEHVFYEQTWKTEIILKIENEKKEVYFHIDCSRDITRFDDVPEIRTDVIRAFVNSVYVKQPRVAITSEPIDVTEELEDWLVAIVKGEYDCEIPLVLATPYFDCMGCAIDEFEIAKKLTGVAYVVVCDNESMMRIKAKSQTKAPFNGSVAIYCAKGKPKVYRQEDAFHGVSLDNLILTEVQKIMMAKLDAEAPTWDQRQGEIIQAETREKSLLLNEAFDENGDLKEQLQRAREKIESLMEENRTLKSKNESLELAIKKDRGNGIIMKGDVEEFYVGEQYDLVVTVLNKALCNYSQDSRAYELIEQLLTVNKELGNGREIFNVVKSVLSEGQAPRANDLSKLAAIGFEIVSEANHYKLRFMSSDKYTFTLYKTPSDGRSGKNSVSDITKRLTVYK